MREYVEIGCTPHDEDCEQLGPNYNPQQARFECQVFIRQLRRELGEEVGTARLKVKSNPHEFGTYLEVACYFDSEDEIGCDYAYRCENEMPAEWDEIARQELAAGYDAPRVPGMTFGDVLNNS